MSDPGRDDTTTEAVPRDESTREPRPPLGSWRALYALIALDLLLVITLCGWLSRIGR